MKTGPLIYQFTVFPPKSYPFFFLSSSSQALVPVRITKTNLKLLAFSLSQKSFQIWLPAYFQNRTSMMSLTQNWQWLFHLQLHQVQTSFPPGSLEEKHTSPMNGFNVFLVELFKAIRPNLHGLTPLVYWDSYTCFLFCWAGISEIINKVD